MEGDEVEYHFTDLPSAQVEAKSVEQSLTPISDMLDKQCAYYMLIGVSYEEFWHGNYCKLKYYREMHDLQVEQRNQELWMQGLYNYQALCTALENAFAKRGTPPKKYLDKPYRITPLSEDEKKIEQQKQVESFRNQLMALDRRFTEKHKREQGGV